jgi:bifunctional DNA-binding transcriptional regulator/antitoxin component of YhaV-PrlF toxin-antitoxin module
MTQDYRKTWECMNSLESVTSKICSAREILDSAIESLESGNRQKTETLLYAADEFLQYYLEDFDRKFKVAWNETVVKLKEEDPCMPPWGHSDLEYLSKHNESLTCDKEDSSPECKGAWTSFWEENYYPEEYKGSTVSSVKQDKVKRWVLPVEEVENGDNGEQEYFITFPDDLLEAANLTEGDQVEWVDNKDGTYTLKKTGDELARVKTYKEIGNELARVKTYQEMINDGWSMTDDGFWIKE